MKPIKIVFDSNVYLAATKQNSYARTQLKRSQPNGPFQLFVSPEIILEIRNKLEVKFNYSHAESSEFITLIMRYAKEIYPKRKIMGILEDHDDHKVLECAAEASAELIITADRGLLRLREFENIKIAHPSMLKYWFKEPSYDNR